MAHREVNSMRVLAVQASPNSDGLTAACAREALQGAQQAGADGELVDLCELDIERCRQCEDGWGICRREGNCIIEDDFQALREKLWAADALILSVPVYYGDLSESAKAFLDRLRRCEATQGENNKVKGTPVLGIAAAGGGGGGTVTCSLTMERSFGPMGMPIFDILPIRQRTKSYVLPALIGAGAAFVEWSQEQQ